MRIQLLSDCHTEFYDDCGEAFFATLDPTDVDVLIVAGDLGTSRSLGRATEILCPKYSAVILVPGNHEFYHSSFPRLQKQVFPELRALHSNLFLLENEGCTIDGQRFLGTTMWFAENPMNFHFQKALSDFKYIENFSMKVYAQNKMAMEFLEGHLTSDDIVVTHHAPSHESVAPKYRGSNLNRFYVCDHGALILRRQPKFWLHGHMHRSVDYTIGETRILANPAGYPRSIDGTSSGRIPYKEGQLQNSAFDPRLIFSV
jgi:Icc-related predicted phosphoesterase